MNKNLTDFKIIVADNEKAVQQAINCGEFIQAFLLMHALIESLLRSFLKQPGPKPSFNGLIKKYEEFLNSVNYPVPTFVNELTGFNRRRNRIVHNLWQHGYTHTNHMSESAANASVVIYGLMIEWIETFDPDISKCGYQYE